jgi:hypothetical protein
MRNVLATLLVAALLISLSGCFPGTSAYSPDDRAGFFSGLWHGWIAPVSLIIGFFRPDVRIYETYNTGWWYDLGFYIAVIGGFGGVAFVRKKRRKEQH